MTKKIENLPNASTLITSMRSIGYNFETAVADIIDNSITAKAKNIDIIFPVGTGEDIFLVIADDGYGMTRDELIEAMRFGTSKEFERVPEDLGRFGLGLKTASISQCKKFSAVSKKEGIISAFTWDLDLIKQTNGWDMFEFSYDDIFNKQPLLRTYLTLENFTIILWEKLDRLSPEVNLLNNEHDVFSNKITNTEKHLSLVFHRYLDEGLNIKINGNKVIPIDPFLQKHPKTISKIEQSINTKTSNGKDEKVKIQVHVLPYHKDLSNEDYAKIGGLEDNQGFYIYRNKRLMLYGTWFRIKPKKELSRNARIRVDIPNTLDDLWFIDVKKQKAIIPSQLLEQLKGEVSEAVSSSVKIYEYKGKAQTKSGSVWNKIVNERDNTVKFEINKESSLIASLISNLDQNALNALNTLFDMVEYSLPYNDIYNSVSQKKTINKVEDEKQDNIISLALDLFTQQKKTRNLSNEEIIKEICEYEPFLSANIKEKLREKING